MFAVAKCGDMDVVKKIRGIARDRRLSLRKLEAQAGLPQARLTKLKDGGYLESDELARIAAVLDLTVHHLLSDAPADASPARLHLEELVTRHGAEVCVGWILDGVRAQVARSPGDPARVVRIVEGPHHLDDLPPQPRRQHERADPAKTPARRKGKGRL
jgi:DNA-binding Xre family transcriptional regulator